MQRREFMGVALTTGLLYASSMAKPFYGGSERIAPMALGLMFDPSHDPNATVALVKQLGMSTCFFSLDQSLGKFSKALANDFRSALDKHGVTATTAEVVGPGPLIWDFIDGPSTIGLVPRATRAARIDALKQTSDFAKLLGIPRLQTHCGFIPENLKDPLYKEVVVAIRNVADHCAANGQDFLMETGQETPTTLLRTIRDVGRPNLGVGLDTANLILYGKANPVDAMDVIGPYVKSVHAKDGKWPTDPTKLGEEVVIGKGLVDFKQVFTKLHKLGYTGAITIERETSGPQQIEDVKQERLYLENILKQIQTDLVRKA
jgi:L-ribulose-5-phosphate 3-epimerase